MLKAVPGDDSLTHSGTKVRDPARSSHQEGGNVILAHVPLMNRLRSLSPRSFNESVGQVKGSAGPPPVSADQRESEAAFAGTEI